MRRTRSFLCGLVAALLVAGVVVVPGTGAHADESDGTSTPECVDQEGTWVWSWLGKTLSQEPYRVFRQKDYYNQSVNVGIIVNERACPGATYVWQRRPKGESQWRTLAETFGNIAVSAEPWCEWLTWCNGEFDYRLVRDGQQIAFVTAKYIPAKPADPRIRLKAPKTAPQDAGFKVVATFSRSGRYDCEVSYRAPAGAYPNPDSRFVSDNYPVRVKGKSFTFYVQTVSEGKAGYQLLCDGRWAPFGARGLTRVR